MHYESIESQRQLLELCERLAAAERIAFDTEFVSEDTYRPQLCLVQVAYGQRLAIIDPLAVDDVRPFWEVLAEPGHETLVHSGREELRFSLEAVGRPPHHLIDVQIAAALTGLEYPAAYSTLIHRLLGQSLEKGETRTDWRRRPLSQRQLEYALQDVVHLGPLCEALQRRIDQLGRGEWLEAEMGEWQRQIQEAERSEQWRRVSGIANLSTRSLAVVRELWRWRDQEARRRDLPPRRILRDDLVVELARRQTSDLKRIVAVRGLDRRGLQRHLSEIARRIDHAMQLTPDELPGTARTSARPQLNLLTQFLSTALGSICRSANVAPSIVGTTQDVRDLISHHLRLESFPEPPLLARGWRAQVVGRVIDELLDGQLAIRITDPLSDHPLAFEPREP